MEGVQRGGDGGGGAFYDSFGAAPEWKMGNSMVIISVVMSNVPPLIQTGVFKAYHILMDNKQREGSTPSPSQLRTPRSSLFAITNEGQKLFL